jgi:phospholipid/cholesterol/gamma-HCH transport system substrate-binding protein
VKRAIRIHSKDFVAIVALFLGAVAVTAFIFAHQPSFTTLKNYYVVKVAFSSASAVTAGQGQTVDVAGVQVGDVGGVTLQNGQAIVTMDISKQYAPIYKNATVLLRPRTPLKDMYLALDPGTKDAGEVPNGGMLPVGATNPTVDFADILNSLDADTRDYLLLLLSGGAQAFGTISPANPAPNPAVVAQLSGLFKRFAPLNRDTAKFTSLLATRQKDIRASIHGLQAVTTSLGKVEGALTSLIVSSDVNFRAISSQSQNLEQALALFPGFLHQSIVTFGKLVPFAKASGAAATNDLNFARALPAALSESLPLFRDTTPVLRNQIRPFVGSSVPGSSIGQGVQPVARALQPAAVKLAKSTPPLNRAFGELNKLFNTLAFQPPGSEQGYLFWGSWLGHITNTLTNKQDAQGSTFNGIFMATCTELQFYEVTLVLGSPSLGPILALLNPPDYSKLPGDQAGQCPLP